MTSILKCAVITPIGPGHEETYERLCVPSVKHAIAQNSGPFSLIELMPIYDLEGKEGRSNSRNIGVAKALAENFDWIFFLDADDLLFGEAFKGLEPIIND